MNAAAFSAMSRMVYRQKHMAVLARMSDAKLGHMAAANYLLFKRLASSSSTPTTTGSSTPTTFGTGEFGNPAPVPKNVTMPPLRPEDEPGPDESPYAYSPVYRKGRFDGLFGDGWRRPPTKEQGQRMRRDWFSFGWHPTDEYLDWKFQHYLCFWAITIFSCGSAFFLVYRPDWPQLSTWAVQEAYIEIARREKYGLPYISKDYIDTEKVAAVLPSEEELGDFEIII